MSSRRYPSRLSRRLRICNLSHFWIGKKLIAFTRRGWTWRLGHEPSRDRAGRRVSTRARTPRAAREDGFVDALLEADDGAEDDRVGMALDDLLDQAVEGCDRIGEDRGAGRERDPLRASRTGGVHARRYVR